MTAFLTLFATTLATLAVASPLNSPLVKRNDVGGFINPTDNGGRWLTLARNTYPEGLGEPINIVISADSDALLMTDTGFFDWGFSIDFSGECLGQSDGAKQSANLGDGSGFINQTILIRENFGDTALGTCRETIEGGEHYRVWRQNGTAANTGAWFLAASSEMDLQNNHMIIPNGYDLGRDDVVRRATIEGGTKSPLTNRTFVTTVANASGPGYFANVTTEQINHGIPTDGIVAVLTVRITSNGSDPNQVIGPQGVVKGQTLSATSAAISSLSSLFSPMQVISTSLFSIFAFALLA